MLNLLKNKSHQLPKIQGEGDGETGSETPDITGPELIEEGIVDGNVMHLVL